MFRQRRLGGSVDFSAGNDMKVATEPDQIKGDVGMNLAPRRAVGEEIPIDENQAWQLNFGSCLCALFMNDERADGIVLQKLFEIGDGAREALAQRRLRCPSEQIVGL